MLDKDEYYCKVFVNKDIQRFQLNGIIKDIVSGRFDGFDIDTWWGNIHLKENEAAKPPWGKVNDEDFIYWRFFMDIEPSDEVEREDYIESVAKLMTELYNNGCQVIAACDFEDDVPKYSEKL
jgi:hypothetical protein